MKPCPGRPLLCSRLIQRSRDNIGGHGQFLVGQRARIEQEGMILKASDQGRNGFEQALLEAFRACIPWVRRARALSAARSRGTSRRRRGILPAPAGFRPCPRTPCGGGKPDARPRRLSSSGAAVIIATVGMRFRASCSSRYSRRVASRAARVILSMRRARLSGFRLIFSMIAFVPTIIPACGPPSTLSPEKVTTSAPAATTERTVGSPGSPAR